MNKSTMKRYKYFDDYDQEYSFDSLTKSVKYSSEAFGNPSSAEYTLTE